MAETAREYTESIATYTNALINERLSLVPQVCRVKKVLFDTKTLITNNMEIDLKESALQYDEIIIEHGLIVNNEVLNRVRTIIQYLPGNAYQVFNYGNNSNNYSGDVSFSSDKKMKFSIVASGAWNSYAHPCVSEIIGIKYVNPNNYSTEEQMVGYWIDGKPLYQKTVNFGALPNNNTKIVAHGISNLDRVVRLEGVAYNADNGAFTLPDVVPSNTTGNIRLVAPDKENVRISTGTDRSSFSAYITLTYTKTTS